MCKIVPYVQHFLKRFVFCPNARIDFQGFFNDTLLYII